jgi:DNA-binding response OmpR family regulator
MSDRILVVDDDPEVREFVKTHLEQEGFEVEVAGGGREALDLAAERPPALVLLDVMMPGMDGLTTLRHLRNDVPTANIPVVMLTAKPQAAERVKGLDLGADDYITKPFETEELVARVRSVIRRAQHMRDLSPLTGLPGNFRITTELENRVRDDRQFAVVYADLDNFKAFNDTYGFMRGDAVIKFTADTLVQVANEVIGEGVFIGHVGGDDFVIMFEPDHIEAFCEAVIKTFDDGILEFYDTTDALQGHIEVLDRVGEKQTFPIASLSMGVATNRHRVINSEWEVSAIATEMKEFAKREPGSVYAVDQRT